MYFKRSTLYLEMISNKQIIKGALQPGVVLSTQTCLPRSQGEKSSMYFLSHCYVFSFNISKIVLLLLHLDLPACQALLKGKKSPCKRIATSGFDIGQIVKLYPH